jgi:isoaspartyl peptidase/L-asparaginase-like protein (Ntn-hydrolase superfamily)
MRVWNARLERKIASSKNLSKRYGYGRRPRAAGKKEAAHDTVGCTVRDAQGKLCAGTSTGGIPKKAHARVGDSPIPGAGVFADDILGALSATGKGETILRSLVSSFVVSRIREELRKDPRAFANDFTLGDRIIAEEFAEMCGRFPGQGGAGIIYLPAEGPPSRGFCTRTMTVAVARGMRGKRPSVCSELLVSAD